MSDEVQWPGGPSSAAFHHEVAKVSRQVKAGKLLAIDPSSGGWDPKTRTQSTPGYALWEAGKFIESGTIELCRGNACARLADLYACLTREFPDVDVLVLEKLRGRMVHHVLHWAVGATVAAVPAPILIEVPIVFWKALAKTKPNYVKADDSDAELMGEVVLRLANV